MARRASPGCSPSSPRRADRRRSAGAPGDRTTMTTTPTMPATRPSELAAATATADGGVHHRTGSRLRRPRADRDLDVSVTRRAGRRHARRAGRARRSGRRAAVGHDRPVPRDGRQPARASRRRRADRLSSGAARGDADRCRARQHRGAGQCSSQECGPAQVWRCLGDWAGDDWVEHGGEEAWGRVRPSVGDPDDTALGLAALRRGGRRVLRTRARSTRRRLSTDVDFLNWLDGLHRHRSRRRPQPAARRWRRCSSARRCSTSPRRPTPSSRRCRPARDRSVRDPVS